MNRFLLLLIVITYVGIARGQFWRPRPPPPPMNPLGTTVVENIEVMGPLGSGLSSRKIVGSNGGYSFQQQAHLVDPLEDHLDAITVTCVQLKHAESPRHSTASGLRESQV
ncbi:hypothetical protein Q1695_007693 [Nippostrongylus brasiliensis]|nr:hypothetical protein Q1695_007693 [Nippostrongylus brasiliensis]